MRRSQKREARIRAKHPKVGGLVLALTDDPSSTKVWTQGAVGEERVGAFLEAARSKGIEVLHDRRIPKSRANIDHLVIAPTGIWVVDPKRYLKGRIEPRNLGGWRKNDFRLFIGGRDQTKLVVGMQKQVDLVRIALAGTDFAGVQVHGVLCFVEAELGWFAKPFAIRGITITWRKHLLSPMFDVAHCPTVLDQARIAQVARHLADTFKPA